MDSLPLFVTIKQRVYFLVFLSFIFLINLSILYNNYTKLKQTKIYHTTATIKNIYKKDNYNILKGKNSDFEFFTSYKNNQLKQGDKISIYIITKNIDFISYLKGFYCKSFNITKIESSKSYKSKLINFIEEQHQTKELSSLYKALYLAIPINSDLRDTISMFGISHLIAISGFHLGLISFILYFILNQIYTPVHTRKVPYRHKQLDILIVVSFILFGYLYFLDFTPSLLRAYMMYILAIFFLINNIKILSVDTLFIATVILISLNPKLLFSISLWLSVAGVYYILLFIKYFENLNRYIQLFLFNFWIFFAINPIVHYLFGSVSLYQLLSPILTLLFTIFYPLSILLHLIGYGYIFDNYIQKVIDLELHNYEIFTPSGVMFIYLIISILGYKNRIIFILLNMILIGYNIWLYSFLF